MEKFEKKYLQTRKVGIIFGLLSGLSYAIYGSLISKAMDNFSFISIGVKAISLSLVVSGLNDFFAGVYIFIYNCIKKKIKYNLKLINLKNFLIIVLCAVLGGVVANTSYVYALSKIDVYAVPLSASYVLFGAIFALLIFKQKLTLRISIGMFACIFGAVCIGFTKVSYESKDFYAGIVFALVAALCWGLEGAISSFIGNVIDSDIVVNIREFVSGLGVLFIVLPLLKSRGLIVLSFTYRDIIIYILLAAFFAGISFIFWYRANTVLGSAIGMSLNITYVFWGVFLSGIFGMSLSFNIILGSVIILVGTLILIKE